MFESIWLRKLNYEKTLCYPPAIPFDVDRLTKWLIDKGIVTVSQLASMSYEQLYELYSKYAEQYYRETLAESQGIFLFLPRMANLVDSYKFTIGYNTAYNFLIDFAISANFHIEIPELSNIIYENFSSLFPSFETVSKGRYGETNYDYSYYDPPTITTDDLRHFSRDARYKYTKKIVPDYDEDKLSLSGIVEILSSLWKSKDIVDFFIGMILEHLTIFEAKIINCAFVGLMVVGVSRIPSRKEVNALITFRNPYDNFNEHTIETATAWDSHVGFMRVGFMRVSPRKSYIANQFNRTFPKEIAELLKSILEYYFETISYKGNVFVPTSRFLKSSDKKKWKGGKHQVVMQSILNDVRKILDRCGIVKWYRMAYINFALEAYYLNHESNRKRKNWKHVLTIEDLKAKYLSYGCNKSVLDEIAKVIT